MYNEELHNLYASPNVTRVIKSMNTRREEHVARMRHEKCVQYFGWKTWREGPLRRPICRWQCNIRIDLWGI